MEKLTLKDIDLNGKRILMRVDFNVPLNEDGSIADETRIKLSLPSIKYILDSGGSLILMSHLGRPKGKRSPEFSLAPCAKRLSDLLGKPVLFAPDSVGEEVKNLADALRPGEVMLLENLRFYDAEEKPEKDPNFAKSLATLGEIYVNNAFGTAHRKHTSTYELAKLFPGKALCGLLMEKEIEFLSSLLSDPKRPFYAIIGGAKLETKIGVLHALLQKVDGIFLGGGMAFTFYKAMGIQIGNSIFDENQLQTAKEFINQCEKKKIPLYLPEDILIADRFANDAQIQTIPINNGIADGWQGMDIGPKTLENWEALFEKAKTIFWNGPMGVFEMPHFANGTNALAKKIASLPLISIVGGGDSVAAINNLHLAEKYTHISTGGGASLKLIELGHLPGVDILTDIDESFFKKRKVS